MSVALTAVTLGVVVVLLVLVVRLAADLQALRGQLRTLQPDTRVIVKGAWGGRHHHRRSMGKGYFALWRWENKKWSLVMGIVPPGASAGKPPQQPGVCTGETRKVWVPSAKL